MNTSGATDTRLRSKLQMIVTRPRNVVAVTADGQRQILFPGRKPPKPILVDVTRVDANLFRIEIHETLAPGEYVLSPEGSNAVFCFAVYYAPGSVRMLKKLFPAAD